MWKESDRICSRSQKHRDGATSYAGDDAATDAGGQLDAVALDLDDADDAKLAQGDAAAYGIFYDDADDYDYLQHLRPVGGDGATKQGAVGDAFFVEAPDSKNQKGGGKRKGKAKDALAGFELSETALARHEAGRTTAATPFEMPEDVLPSHPLDEVSYAELTTSRVEPGGLRPELDPSIREVLEALDDDAYAEGEEDDEDAFWNGVLSGGQVGGVEEQEWEDDEEGANEVPELVVAQQGVEKLAIRNDDQDDEGSWAAVKQFKAANGGANVGSDDEDEEDYASEGGDTIADLRSSLAKTKRPLRKASGSAMGSAFSMSSSSMFRNDGLRTLDDRFDQVRSSRAPRIDSRLADPHNMTRRSKRCMRKTRTTRGAVPARTTSTSTVPTATTTTVTATVPRRRAPNRKASSAPRSKRSWTISSKSMKSSAASTDLNSKGRATTRSRGWTGYGTSWPT